MSAHNFATADELADMQRQMDRELDKLEQRMQRDIEAVKLAKRGDTVVAHPGRDLAEIRGELRELRAMVAAVGRLVRAQQITLEELSLEPQ